MHRRQFLRNAGTTALVGTSLLPARALADEVRVAHSGFSVGTAQQSLAYHWIDVLQDVSARDVMHNQARPTIFRN